MSARVKLTLFRCPVKLISAIAAITITALSGALFATNPTEADYADYAAQTLSDEVQDFLCRPDNAGSIPPISTRIDRAISGLCERTIGSLLSSEEVQEVLLTNTERKNRFLFSTYETTFPDRTYKTIGAFGQFYSYDVEK